MFILATKNFLSRVVYCIIFLGDYMKKLEELYPGVGKDVLIKGIKINSKEVEDGDLFVCTMGVTADRHDFIPDAKAHGAAALVVSKDITDPDIPAAGISVCRFFHHR